MKLSDEMRDYSAGCAEKDQPEGTFFVQISGTLLGKIIDRVAALEDEIEESKGNDEGESVMDPG